MRGFKVKLYTSDGHYDLAGNNIPVLLIQDGLKFPNLIHAIQP
ncbi:catalase [Microcoleus sp. D3_18a_C4]